jgi:tetratricopeptide (TPR) repeat protein
MAPLLAGAPARADLARTRGDADAFARLVEQSPGAAERLGQGETFAAAGHLEEAVALFDQAARQAPIDPLVARRQCEALASLGRHEEAVEACKRARPDAKSPLAARAFVRASLSGNQALPVEEMTRDLLLARDARDRWPAEPWGYAAYCDIGERLGDNVMLQKCLQGLERVAPHHPETVRARAALASRGPGVGLWVGWAALAAAGLGTVAHAGRRALRRRAVAGPVGCALVALAVAGPAGAVPSPDHPDRVSDWAINDQDPVSSVPADAQKNRNPLEFAYWLMDLGSKAQTASKRGDHQAAIRYFLAMAKAVPDRPVSFQHLCHEYEAAGQHDKAISACNAVLYLNGATLNDYVDYIRLVLGTPGDLSTADRTSLASVIKHLREDPNGKSAADLWECEVGVRTRDAEQLEECTAAMALRSPNDPQTTFYEWTLAMIRGDIPRAETLVVQARALNMRPDGLQRIEADTRAAAAKQRTTKMRATLAAFFALIAAVGGGLFLWMRRRDRAAALSGSSVVPTVEGGA